MGYWARKDRGLSFPPLPQPEEPASPIKLITQGSLLDGPFDPRPEDLGGKGNVDRS